MPKIWAMPAASLIRCKKTNSKDSQELLNRLAVRSTICRSTGQQAIDRKRSETVHTLREYQVVRVFGHFTVGGRGHWPLAQLGLGRLPCSLPDPPPPPPSPPPPLFLDPSLCGLAAKKQAGRDNRAMRQKIFPCVFLSWQSFGIFWNSGQT